MHPGTRILVADDDPELLDTMATVLEGTGAAVVRAASGAELLEQVANGGPFELIVADVAMPFTTGLFAMHSARNSGLDTPVIIVTALRDENLPDQVRSLGENALLLHKPFSLSELESAASKLLSSDQASQAR